MGGFIQVICRHSHVYLRIEQPIGIKKTHMKDEFFVGVFLVFVDLVGRLDHELKCQRFKAASILMLITQLNPRNYYESNLYSIPRKSMTTKRVRNI